MAANICPHLHSFTSCPHTPPPLHTRPPVPPSPFPPTPSPAQPPRCPEFIHDSLRLSGAAVLLGRMLFSCVSVPVNRVLGARFSSSSDHLFVGLVPSFGHQPKRRWLTGEWGGCFVACRCVTLPFTSNENGSRRCSALCGSHSGGDSVVLPPPTHTNSSWDLGPR